MRKRVGMNNRRQLNAISYAYRNKRLKKQNEVLEKYNLLEDFKTSKYKGITNYLKQKYKEGVISFNEIYGD